MNAETAYTIVMKRHGWSQAHLLSKEVCRILAKEMEELQNQPKADPHDPDGGVDVMECPHKGRYIR